MGDQQAWPKGFREQFLDDFIHFLGDSNHTPQYTHVNNVNNNNNTSFPSQEDLRFLAQDVSRYIMEYVNHYHALMDSRQKPPQPHPLPSDNQFSMKRFINQNDDHFTGIKFDPVPLSTATDPRIPIQQATRGLPKWPKDYTGTSLTATTREHSQNKAHKTVASHTAATTISVESAVGGLCQPGPSSRGGVSRAGSLNGIRSYRCDNRDKKRPHPGELVTSNQGMSAEVGGGGSLNRRASAGSRVSSISRREQKQHTCPVCHENFPFNARLQ